MSSDDPPSASPAERIHAARFVLAAAGAVLLAGTGLFALPLAYALAAGLLLVVVAAFVPRRPATARQDEQTRNRSTIWPDGSVKATLEAFPRAGFILDAEGIVRYANARAIDIFAATRPGDPFTFTFRRPGIAEALRDAQAGQANTLDYQEPGEASAAYSLWFSPLRPAGAAAGFVLVIFEDVSDRLAIARMRSDFVANASHELRTPLASLTGFIETLMGPARNDPQASERFLKIMLDQARRMRRLLDDLLSLSRAEMKVHRRPTDRVDLVAVLSHVADALGPLASENGVALSVEPPARPVWVTGDRDELIQVFQNLFENGIRYGASGGRVDVVADIGSAEPPAVRVQVQDRGPGIAAEHLPRLTERFYRVDAGASRDLKGTGLGLAIVKHILTRHQGQLEVRSEPGEGACFTVTLPLEPAEIGSGEISQHSQ